MAVSELTGTGNGVLRSWTIPFPYIHTSHVKMTVDGAPVDITVAGSTVTLAAEEATPTSENDWRIYRETPRSSLATYLPITLNDTETNRLANLQIIYIAQEVQDAVDKLETPGNVLLSEYMENFLQVASADAGNSYLGWSSFMRGLRGTTSLGELKETLEIAAPVPGGRLTLVSGSPVMTSDQAGKTTLFYTPFTSPFVPLYDGTKFHLAKLSGDISVLTTDTTKNPAAIGANKLNDWFLWDDGGEIRLSHGTDWSNDTSRGTATGIARVDGIRVNADTITNGPASGRGTYVGTTRSDASGRLNWLLGGAGAGGSAARLDIWNAYNRITVGGRVSDTTDTWTYSVASWRPANNSTANRVSVAAGFQEDALILRPSSQVSTAVAGSCHCGIGWNSTIAPTGPVASFLLSGPNLATVATHVIVRPFGYEWGQQLEKGTAAGTTTWYGDNGTSEVYTALEYLWRC